MQILTEAVIRLEADGAEAFPEIDWKGYRGMGNFLRHSYDRVADDIVWNTVQEDLPVLKRIAEEALTRIQSRPPNA
ncbi:MAG TPA: HepT-like ribonuclease domain-containing protein [Bryobacteraceae bacterium]|nr:HepT-like ribonuclease domain-containing protein [Bryobacteraceae bacterium]